VTAVDGLWGSVVVALVLSDLGSEEKHGGKKDRRKGERGRGKRRRGVKERARREGERKGGWRHWRAVLF